MKAEEYKLKCFNQAEEELLPVILAMERCRDEHEWEMLLNGRIDYEMISFTVANLQANTKKLEMMYSALFMLSNTYNKQFASYLCRDRIQEVMKLFEELKDTVGDLKQALPELQKIPIDLPTNEDTYKECYKEYLLTIDEPECYLPEENIFEGNIFTAIDKIRSCSEEQIIGSLLTVFCKFYKVVIAIFMMCKTIIQEEMESLNSQEQLENIYQESLQEVWDSVKDFASKLHKEDYLEEIEEVKQIAADKSLLQKCFHQWSIQKFTDHAIAAQFYNQMQNEVCINKLLLFPDNPEKELDAIKVAESLDSVIVKTRKSDNTRTFSTRSIAVLKEAIGYDGGNSLFLRFLQEHYPGVNRFPDISAFSVDSKKMLLMKPNSLKADEKKKWEKCQEEADGVKSRVDLLLHKTYSIGAMRNLPNRASAS